MRHLGRALIVLACLPWDLTIGAAVYALADALGWRLEHDGAVVWVRMPDGRAARLWRYSTTVLHVVVMHPQSDASTERHELEHVRQFEGACVALWLAVGLASLHPLAAIIPGPWLPYAGASVAAWLRGEHWYRANDFERAARALAGQEVE